MASEAGRRKKPARTYSIMVVPRSEGGKTRSLNLSLPGLLGLLVLATGGIAGGVLALLVATPLGAFVPIPNPELERRYGRQLVETQEQLRALAEDVLLLRDYNQQLRKVLGSDLRPDSARLRDHPPSEMLPPVAAAESVAIAGSAAEPPLVFTEPAGSYDLVAESYEGEGYGAEETGRPFLPLMTPVEGFLSRGFDQAGRHFGMDYATRAGTPVHAATDGTVLFAGWTPDDGNMIMISHGAGWVTVYKHNQALLRTALEEVRRGEPVALAGSTGRASEGPHLHFELWRDGTPVDPRPHLLSDPVIQ
ncbi:MAG: M23 family metallopeptidase [Bacteroidota bacterium]